MAYGDPLTMALAGIQPLNGLVRAIPVPPIVPGELLRSVDQGQSGPQGMIPQQMTRVGVSGGGGGGGGGGLASGLSTLGKGIGQAIRGLGQKDDSAAIASAEAEAESSKPEPLPWPSAIPGWGGPGTETGPLGAAGLNPIAPSADGPPIFTRPGMELGGAGPLGVPGLHPIAPSAGGPPLFTRTSGLGGLGAGQGSLGAAASTPIAPAANAAAARAISGIESGGKYSQLGPITRTGDRAYGKYQVMGANVPKWTETYTGKKMTPAEFLESPQAQEAVFSGEFGRLSSKYGPEGASRAWFAGESGMNDLKRKDILGTSVGDYGRMFRSSFGGGVSSLEPKNNVLPLVLALSGGQSVPNFLNFGIGGGFFA